MLASMFSAPQILIASLVKIKYEEKQKQRAMNTAFITFALVLSLSYCAIGNKFITKPYEVKVILTESIIFSIKSLSVCISSCSCKYIYGESLLTKWSMSSSCSMLNYIRVRVQRRRITPRNKIWLWNFSSERFFLSITGRRKAVTRRMYVVLLDSKPLINNYPGDSTKSVLGSPRRGTIKDSDIFEKRIK